MTFPKARLVVSACLFVSWIGFLIYLVAQSPAVIVSKARFLVADYYVVAEIAEENGRPNAAIAIQEVLWPEKAAVPVKMTIPDLAVCQAAEGFKGPGKYFLALTRTEAGGFDITPIPHTPRYPYHSPVLVGMDRAGDQPDKVVSCLTRVAGLDKKQAEAIVASTSAPLIVGRRMTYTDSRELARCLEEAGAIGVFIKDEELKMWPVTPETRTQIEKLIESKRSLTMPTR